MNTESNFLTDNLQILTVSHIYTAFLFKNNVENWYGICEFENNDIGHKLHLDFIEFIQDMNLQVAKTDYEFFLQLRDNNGEGVLPSNYYAWSIRDVERLEFLKKQCIWVINNI